MKSKRDIFRLCLNFLLKALFCGALIKISSLCKCSFVFGSKFATFSGSCATIPLTGAFAGGLVSFVIFAASCFLRYLIFGIASLHVFAFYLPGLCAAFYFSSLSLSRICIRLVLPVLCIALFLCNPVGLQAFAYSLFWLIPIVIYFLDKKNIFLDALAATFIAHAVGSVIFLYTVSLPAVAWNALIPIVALERLAIASLIYVLYKVFDYVRKNAFDKTLHFVSHCGKILRVKFVR